MINKLSENLKLLLNSYSINEAKLARNTGIAQPVINRMVRGVTTNPNVATLQPIASFFSITIDDLLSGSFTPKFSKLMGDPADTNKIPLLTWHEAAEWQPSDIKNSSSKYSLIESSTITMQDGYALKIEDDYDGKFSKGTILIVNTKATPKHRDYVIVTHTDKSFTSLKRLIIDGENKYLKPIDPELKTIEFTPEYTICGVVTQSIFRFS